MASAAQVFQGLAADERRAVQQGGLLLQASPTVLPDQRPYRDVFFAILFLITFVALTAVALETTDGFTFSSIEQADRDRIPLQSICLASFASVLFSSLLSMGMVEFIIRFTEICVWAALLVSPCIMFAVALAMPLIVEDKVAAMLLMVCLIIPALLSLAVIFCCWKHLVPFTVELLHATAVVMSQKSGMILVGAIGSLAMLVWTLLSSLATVGIWSRAEYMDDNDNALYFIVCMLMLWGSAVCMNTCHVTYCGIIGRWYFGKEASVRRSLQVALTTSFGSICMGSLLVAAVQAANALLKKLKRDAREEAANPVILCTLCLLQCLVQCVEDMVEALTYFSYVQVALRGYGFLDSVCVTYALCTFRNIYGLVACSLVSSVVGMAAMGCGVITGLVGCAVAYVSLPVGATHDERAFAATLSLAIGVVLGGFVAGNILQALQSGFATLCVGFAEASDRMGTLRPDLHRAFEERTGLPGS